MLDFCVTSSPFPFRFSLVSILSRVPLSMIPKDGISYEIYLTAKDLSIDRRYCGDLSIS